MWANQIGSTNHSPASSPALIDSPELRNSFFLHWNQRTLCHWRIGTTCQRNVLLFWEWTGRLGHRRRNRQGSRRRRGRGEVGNRHKFQGRSVELRRRTPGIGGKLWQTYSGNWRALAVCTPAQPPCHLLTTDSQLCCPVFILLKTCPQQYALFPVPIYVLPVTIQSLFKRPLQVILTSQNFA